MTEEERNKKFEEISNTLDKLESFLAQNGITLDDSIDEDDEYDDEDDDITCEELDGDGDGVGYGFGFNLDKLFDPQYNEHILSEPDEDGMVEISDELYDRLYGKYHSKEDMLSDITSELERYISGKYYGYEGYWSKVRYLGINKESNRPRIAQVEELEKEGEYDLYDINEFVNRKSINDSGIRKLIDKYYPDLEW